MRRSDCRATRGLEGTTIKEWPWERSRNPATFTPDDKTFSLKDGFTKFASKCLENKYPDIYTKIAAIKASASVVSLVTSSDDKEISEGTGTIIEEDGTILTSAKLLKCPTSENVVAKNLKVIVYLWDGKSYEAQLLAHDFYYDIAVVKIREDVPLLKPACLRLVDDCISVDPSELHNRDDKGFPLRRHSTNAYNLVPGDKVIALGRYFIEPYELMVAPGEFSIKRCDADFECKELFRTTCFITETGVGGPLVNFHGEVIGVASSDLTPAHFIPINVALKWWEHCKKYGKLCRRPLLGMKMANVYTTDLQVMEKVIHKFTKNFAGVIVEEVIRGSSADNAGVCPNDLIVRCCGKNVGSFLELYDMMWDKTGDSVDLVVIRASDHAPLHITMEVVDATQSKKRKKSKKRTRS